MRLHPHPSVPGFLSGHFPFHAGRGLLDESTSRMTKIYWPGTNVVKSQQNAFTTHLRNHEVPVIAQTKVCKCCGVGKPKTSFSGAALKCSQCRYQEQLMRKRHGGAYSRA